MYSKPVIAGDPVHLARYIQRFSDAVDRNVSSAAPAPQALAAQHARLEATIEEALPGFKALADLTENHDHYVDNHYRLALRLHGSMSTDRSDPDEFMEKTGLSARDYLETEGLASLAAQEKLERAAAKPRMLRGIAKTLARHSFTTPEQMTAAGERLRAQLDGKFTEAEQRQIVDVASKLAAQPELVEPMAQYFQAKAKLAQLQDRLGVGGDTVEYK